MQRSKLAVDLWISRSGYSLTLIHMGYTDGIRVNFNKRGALPVAEATFRFEMSTVNDWPSGFNMLANMLGSRDQPVGADA